MTAASSIRRLFPILLISAHLLSPGTASAESSSAGTPSAESNPQKASSPPETATKDAIEVASGGIPAGITHRRTVGQIEEYQLDTNGLTVLLLPNDGLPVATVMVTYKVGSRNEVTGTTGATHILEHMMFKGTERFNSEDGTDYSSQMERIGAQANATTWLDRTNYFATLPRDYVPLAIELEADRMRNLRIREADLASEMTVVRNEYERGENSPVRTLIKELFATAFMAHPYGQPTIGWESDIENTTVDKLRAFYDQYYWPENAVLTVIGGFDKSATLEAVVQHYGAIEAAPRPIPELTTVEPEQLGPRRVTIERVGQVGVVMVGFKVPAGRDEDWPALALLQQLLGADQTGRLYRALEDKGKASATFTFAPQLRDPGLFIFGAYLTPEATHEEVEAIIWDEIESLLRSGVASDELERTKSVIEASTIYGRDGPYGIADQINEAIAMGDWTAYVNLPEAISAVSADELQAAAERVFLPEQSTTGWFVPRQPEAASLTGADLPGPIYFLDPAVFAAPALGPRAARAADEQADPAASVVDFSSSLQRARIGPIELIAVDMPIEGAVSFVGSLAGGDSLSEDDAPMLASLTAAMLDKGTTTADRFTIAERLDALGADIGFSGGDQSLNFSGRFLRADAGAVMELLADQLRNPRFDPAVLETVKVRQKGNLLRAIDNPDYRASSELSRLLYPPNHVNYSESIDRLLADLEATTAEDLARFHQRNYGAQTLRFVFAGDIDFAQLQAAVATAFEDWQAGAEYPTLLTEQVPNTARSERLFIEDKTSVAVRFGYNTGLRRTDPDYLAFMVGNYILGGSFHSRLMTEVRKNRGLTYDIRSRHDGDILTPGHWLLSASFSPPTLEEGLAAARELVDAWYREGVSEAEFAAAITTLRGSYLVGLSTTARVAAQIESFMRRGFDPTYIDQYPVDLQALTVEEVNRAITTHFDPAQLTEVIAGTFVEGAPERTPSAETGTPITVRLDVPDAGWRIEIDSVFRTDKHLVVLSQLERAPGDAALQVISTVADSVALDGPSTQSLTELPRRHYVAGKTWNWETDSSFSYVDSLDTVKAALKGSELLYSAEN